MTQLLILRKLLSTEIKKTQHKIHVKIYSFKTFLYNGNRKFVRKVLKHLIGNLLGIFYFESTSWNATTG